MNVAVGETLIVICYYYGNYLGLSFFVLIYGGYRSKSSYFWSNIQQGRALLD